MPLPCFAVVLFMLTLTPDLLHTLGNHIIFILMHLYVSLIFPFFSLYIPCNATYTAHALEVTNDVLRHNVLMLSTLES